jgi:hypothetical protein
MIFALGRAAVGGIRKPGATAAPGVPGPWVEARIAPPTAALVRDYIRHVGGDPAWYRGRLPPHFFAHWGLPLAARALAGLAYPVARIINAGCRIESRAPLAADEPLDVRARIEAVDDDGKRVIVTQRVITGTAASPDAVVADLRAFIPLAPRNGGSDGKRNGQEPLVPAGAREIAFMRIGKGAGLDFAKLTGDFNPVHWLAPYARAAGFRGCILHGFSTLARAIEALHRSRFSGDPSRLAIVDARFTKPLLLPASVGVYVASDGRLWVGDAPQGRIYLEGQFQTHPPP